MRCTWSKISRIKQQQHNPKTLNCFYQFLSYPFRLAEVTATVEYRGRQGGGGGAFVLQWWMEVWLQQWCTLSQLLQGLDHIKRGMCNWADRRRMISTGHQSFVSRLEHGRKLGALVFICRISHWSIYLLLHKCLPWYKVMWFFIFYLFIFTWAIMTVRKKTVWKIENGKKTCISFWPSAWLLVQGYFWIILQIVLSSLQYPKGDHFSHFPTTDI